MLIMDKHTLALISIIGSSLDVLGAMYLAYDLLPWALYSAWQAAPVVGACSPFIEWTADHLPARRMGIFGVVLILIGFTLQSVQYWLALMDVTIR